MKKRILIIGEVVSTTKELIEKLVHEGHEVIVASKKNVVSNIVHMKLDLVNLESVRAFLKEFNKRFAYLDVLLFQEQQEKVEHILTSEGYDPLIAMHYLSPVLISEGLKVSLKTEKYARIVYVVSETSLKGETQNVGQLFSVSRSYSNAMRMLMMYAIYASGKLKADHVTVNMITKPQEERGRIKKLFSKTDHHTSDDLYYLIMSDDLRFKTSKLFNGKQIMVIPQDKILKEEIHLLMRQTKKILRLQ